MALVYSTSNLFTTRTDSGYNYSMHACISIIVIDQPLALQTLHFNSVDLPQGSIVFSAVQFLQVYQYINLSFPSQCCTLLYRCKTNRALSCDKLH